MLKWQLISDDAWMAVYRKERAGYKAHLHIDKENMTASFTESVFELHEGAYSPQWREKSEWVKYSATYGTWYQNTYEASIEDIEFALTLLRACSNRAEVKE